MKWIKIATLTSFLCIPSLLHAHKIAIIGCGYVGLTTASVLSRGNHSIICFDIDSKKIASLCDKKLSLYEPQLEEFLFNNNRNPIHFVNNLNQILDSDYFFICVNTPTQSDGSCDCSMLYSIFNDIANNCSSINASKIVCIKSTVPPGTVRSLHNSIQNPYLQVVYNPEFMREGSAIKDILTSNPLVIGGESRKARERVKKLYAHIIHPKSKIIETNFETAELIKYAWNSFSAIRIAYANELALLCRSYNADSSLVIQGLALSEQLLPTQELKPGPGYGGSCLPKDTLSFAHVLDKNGLSSSIIHQVINSNQNHIKKLITDIVASLNDDGTQKIVTLLGLTYKANTNDIRNAPSITIIQALLEKGVTIQAYDPKAIDAMKELFAQVHYFECPYRAIENSDCIVALVEWDQIKNLDFEKVAQLCHQKMIIDTRSMYDIALLKKHNFSYLTIGNKCAI